jgi:hypothetical protein
LSNELKVFYAPARIRVCQFVFFTEAERMNTTRWLMVAALGMLSSTWAQATVMTTIPGHYLITLDGWADYNPEQEFTFIPNPTLPEGVTESDFIDAAGFCPAGDYECSCGDPSVGLGAGGKSQSEDGTFNFYSTGSLVTPQVLDFENTGAPITEVLITVPLEPGQDDETFTCSGDGLFSHCGFMDDPGTLEILYYGGTGIPTAVPEPSQWTMLLLALAGVIVARARKASASSSFAPTRR